MRRPFDEPPPPPARTAPETVTERQKATRLLKQRRKRLESVSPADSSYSECQRAVHQAEVDLNYARYFPLMMKYQSLYAKQDAPEADGPATQAKRPDMWYRVEQAMTEGTLDDLRNMDIGTTVQQSPTARGPDSGVSMRRSEPVERSETHLKDRLPETGQEDASPEEAGSDSEGFFEE